MMGQMTLETQRKHQIFDIYHLTSMGCKVRKIIVFQGSTSTGHPHQAQVENISLEDHLSEPRRTSLKDPAAVVRGDMVAWIIQDHLHHLKSPGEPSESFAGSCLQGLAAALGVFGRALHVLGRSPRWQDEAGEDRL